MATSTSQMLADRVTASAAEKKSQKEVPHSRELRSQIRACAHLVAAKLNKGTLLTKPELEVVAAQMLADSGLSADCIGWAMVAISNEFWRESVSAVPPARRLLLLPRCLRHEGVVPENYPFGIDCFGETSCSLKKARITAEELGYQLLVIDESLELETLVMRPGVDAMIGVASLEVLEQAIDEITASGIPCLALPTFLCGNGKPTIDFDSFGELLSIEHQPAIQTHRSYVHIMRTAAEMFSPNGIDRLVKRTRSDRPLTELAKAGVLESLDPVAATEAIACNFLGRGGKYSRPFMTLAAYEALTDEPISDAVQRAAMSIEAFHKASLIHDDIEDGDEFRYGEPAIHCRWGESTAINVGDYLIGLGYRLVSREVKSLGAEVVADILDCLAQAHMRLSEGQGAELLWRDSREKRLDPDDALQIYALKTAPALKPHCTPASA